MHRQWMNLLYGLQAAINFKQVSICFPFTLWSHIISLIKPIASVVLASSKNSTVSNCCSLFFVACNWASFTTLMMSSSVVPPCTYEYFVQNPVLNIIPTPFEYNKWLHKCLLLTLHRITFKMNRFFAFSLSHPLPSSIRSHMYWIKCVFPQPVSPISTTGIPHLKNGQTWIDKMQQVLLHIKNDWYRSCAVDHNILEYRASAQHIRVQSKWIEY